MSFVKQIRWLLANPAPQAQRVRRAVKILFLIALFGGMFWLIPLPKVLQAMFSARPGPLAVGFFLGFVSTVLTAFEMEPLTRKQGLRHGVGEILEINLAVKFYSQFTPTTLIGSGLRWYRLAQPDGKTAEALAALAFFRMLETFLTVAMGLGFWLASSGGASVEVSAAWLVGLILLIILAWIGVTRWSVPLYRAFKARAAWLDRPWLRPITRRLEKFLVAVAAYVDIPAWDLFLAVFWGVASVLAGVASGVYVAQAVGIDLGFMQMGWIQAVVLLATQLPFAVAGGLGIREVSLVAMLAAFGVSAELTLAYSFLLLVRGLLISLLGGLTEALRAARLKQSGEAGALPPKRNEL